jgi:sigma-E factor negative regulatory protein RseC
MNASCQASPSGARIETIATVARLEKDHAIVLAERASACGGCASASGCATGTLAARPGDRMNAVRARNDCGAKPGDRVVITMPEGVLLRGSLRLYAVPLAGLLAGAFASALAGLGDGVVALSSFAGLALGLVYAGRYARQRANDPDFEPVIVRRVTEAGTSNAVVRNDLAA